jgi:hypothetical protein
VLVSAASNRKAERPVNATLNCLYALVEAEATLACQAVGLDPGLGIVHADAKGCQSLALDLMESVRPEVDGFVLDMVERRTFHKVEFTETNDGHVSLLAPLTHELAGTMPPVGEVSKPDRRARRPRHRYGDGRHVLGGDSPHISPSSRCASGREGTQGVGPIRCHIVNATAEVDQCQRTAAVDVSRLRRSCHERSPRPMRCLHRRRPRLDARNQGPPWSGNRGPQASTHQVGQSQSRNGLRP